MEIDVLHNKCGVYSFVTINTPFLCALHIKTLSELARGLTRGHQGSSTVASELFSRSDCAKCS